MNEDREVRVLDLPVQKQNQLQALAVRLSKADRKIEQGNAERDKVKERFYPLLDKAFGPNTHIVYEARAPLNGQRLIRQIGWTRRVDEQGLLESLTPEERREVTTPTQVLKDMETIRALLPPQWFNMVVEWQDRIDPDKLEAARDEGRVDAEKVAEHVEWIPTPTMRLRSGGPRSKLKLAAGQVAIIGSPEQGQEA